jgi:hypothetical protein
LELEDYDIIRASGCSSSWLRGLNLAGAIEGITQAFLQRGMNENQIPEVMQTNTFCSPICE